MSAEAQEAVGPDGVTAEITRLAIAIRYADLPADVVRFAKHCVLDFVAVTIAGSIEPLAEIMREDVLAEGGNKTASLIATRHRATAAQAALVNGATAHVLDYDDTNFTMNGHISASSLPALLAIAEEDRRSGRDLITAYVAGAEFACRVGCLVEPGHYLSGFHATATLGTFAAAAGCSRLLGLLEDPFRHAIGLAGTQAAGLRCMFGTMAKPFHAGRAAQTGLVAARLARRGFTGQLSVLEMPHGFASTHSADFSPARALRLPSRGFHLLSTLFKFHAACHGTHGAIEAGRQARQALNCNPDDIRSIFVEVGAITGDVCNIQEPTTEHEAKFSIRLMTAFALAGIDTSRRECFAPEVFQSERIRALRDRIEVVLREDFSVTFARLTVKLTNGSARSFEMDCGEPASDLNTQEATLSRKFLSLTTPYLGDTRAEQLLDALLELEQVGDVRVLGEMWAPDAA
jgi:2-methylcitrate dehydratase PrpD